MSKPPSSPPSSDIDGVDEDFVRSKDAALQSGQDSADLEFARKEAVGKPRHSPDKSKDERSR